MGTSYNSPVRSKISFTAAVRLIRFSSFLWLGYLAILGIINQSFGDPRRGDTEIAYYIMLSVVALICLGFSYWPWIQQRLNKSFIPMLIVIITLLPIAITWIIFKYFPHGPNFNSESLVLRLLPFLLVGILLVVWQYRWQYFLLIVLGITGLNTAILWSFPAPANAMGPNPFFRGALTIPLIQTAVFLAVGFCISYLMTRLRKQQESLEAANIQLTNYASTLDELATSRERNRLARELHDTLAHTLSGLSVQLETIKAYWNVDPIEAQKLLDKSLTTARSGLEETRRALKALRAGSLDELGLSQAIRVYAQDVANRNNLKLNIDVADQLPALAADVEQSVYRIAQESINNVINHSAAKNFSVKLESMQGKISLTVSDDGIGFNPDSTNKASQFGILGMKERAQQIGGALNITSNPGLGTTVQLTV